MGLFGIDTGRALAAGLTLGGSELVGENVRSKIPIIGPLTGAKSDEEKALEQKQAQMAEEAKRRQAIQEQARMNALAQGVLAFNPRNQLIAKMFGPSNAFTPQQMAQMAQNPYGAYKGTWGQGSDQERQQQVKDRDAERRRQEMIVQGMAPPSQGPAPMRLTAPAGARRF